MEGNLKIGLGAIIALHYLPGRKKYKYLIVGDDEPTNPKKGIISISSPLAQALIDRQAGDIFEFMLPSGALKLIQVVSVSY